jgi:hypothetical protein
MRNEAIVCAARVSRPELGIETRGASNREGKAIGYSSMRLDTVPKAMPVADVLRASRQSSDHRALRVIRFPRNLGVNKPNTDGDKPAFLEFGFVLDP